MRQPRIIWVLENYCVRGEPISFSEYRYMLDIYADEAQRIVVKKSAQCGGSEWLIAESLYLAGYLGLVVVYYFPHQSQANDFSWDRINRAILGSPGIKRLVKNIDNVKLKQVGDGSIYIRGADSMDNVVNVAADCILRDEEDLINPEVIPVMEERLGASAYKLVRVIGNPTIPNFGIDKLYIESDRRRWFLRCEHCNEWQYLVFPDNIDFQRRVVVCRKCRGEMDRSADGEWVAEYPSRDVHGYHISQLINPRVSVDEIIAKSQRKSESEIQAFYNFVLGEARVPQGQQFNEAMIMKCCEPQYVMPVQSDEATTAGVDVGKLFHIRVSRVENGKRRAVFIGATSSYADLEAILRRYRSLYVVIDAAPETRLAKDLAGKLVGRVYLAYFNDNQKELYVVKKVENYNVVMINRTQAMDVAYADFLECQNILPQNLPPDYVSHLLNATRRIEKDKYGNDKPVWVRAGDDHYFLAEVYDTIAKHIYLDVLSKVQKIKTKIIKPSIQIEKF
ncbi:MAG: phage terminase large subunit family protein [candidate division WOR-3 bacterium]